VARLFAFGELMQGTAAPSNRVPRATADPVSLPSKVVDDSIIQAALAVHLGRKFESEVAIADFARKSSGFSWITYSFVARLPSKPDRKLILRVGPPNGLFAPYSVLPQVNALQSLAGTVVPVPALVSFDEEGAEVGFPFFVCEHVEGEVPAPWASSALGEDHRRDVAGQFIAILGELHKFDWRGTPLAASDVAGEARGEVRAIRVWRASLARPTARYYPLLDWGGRWLEENCPLPPRRTFVHGEYRIGNFLEQEQKITAILDWELTHLGDPHEDLAWALMPTFNAGSRKFYGVVERDEVIDLYQRVSGIPVSGKSLAFYEAFALYQAAAIQMCAVHAFEVDRFNDMRMAVMASQMASIVRAFDRALETAA
jgi:aminoglycoside phosphotransferase (APT) family kinase protein